MSGDLKRVLVADVEGERLRIIDAQRGSVLEDVALPAGSWPTRAIEVAPDTYQVLLRGTGQLATVKYSADTKSLVSTVDVCAEPRGLTLDAAHNETLVACAGGELVHVSGSTATAEQTGLEWRDVAVTPTGVVGTTFRAAQLVKRTAESTIPTRLASQRVSTDVTSPVMHVPQVAWRMARGATETLVVHQLHADSLTVEMPNQPNQPPTSGSGSPYGGGNAPSIPGLPPPCTSSAVVTGVTRITDSGDVFTAHTNDVLPVDAALSPDGSMLAIAGAGGTGLSVYPTSLVQGSNGCITPTGGVGGLAVSSVAWLSNTKLVVLESLRSTPLVFDLATGLARPLGSGDRALSNAAHSLFHTAPRGGAALACASCHPEGGEDGHTWVIDGQFRRTQTLAGAVMERAPFHWRGDLSDLSALMTDTFVKRMGASPVNATDTASLGVWLNTIPAPRASRVLSADARAAGLAAFEKASCSGCHLAGGTKEGPAADIGTGEAVRSPHLVGIAARAPYLHTGEIPDLRSRVMGTLHPNHGALSRLNAAEKESLLAYLESL